MVKRKHGRARIAHVTHRNDKSRVDPTKKYNTSPQFLNGTEKEINKNKK